MLPLRLALDRRRELPRVAAQQREPLLRRLLLGLRPNLGRRPRARRRGERLDEVGGDVAHVDAVAARRLDLRAADARRPFALAGERLGERGELVGKDCMPTEVSENVQAQKMTYEAYCEKYEKELDTLAEGGDIETKSQNKNPYARIEAYLSKHTYLVCEHALGYLLLKALYEEMDGVVGRDKVLSTAKAGFALKSISDFATANKRTMLDQYKPFFVRLLENDEKVLHEYELAEMDYVEKLIERAEKKKMEEEAEAKKVEGTTQTGVEEIENPPLGPGGLNPIEVFESLPEEMQTAFESGDVEALREYVNGLSMKDAKFYMRRMVDSGLWVPQEGEHPGTALVDSGDDEEEKEKVRDDDDETKAT